MGLFDRFRSPANVDQSMREKLVALVLDRLTEKNGRIRVEDAISASATIVGERCIDATGDFPLREHDLAPGSRVFSLRANELICGDVTEDMAQMPPDSHVESSKVLLSKLPSSLAEVQPFLSHGR